MRLEKCRSCGAWIFWARNTKSGKLMPIDHKPVADGNVLVDDRGGEVKATVTGRLTLEEVVPLPRYVSHFSTCPEAKAWRKR